MKRVMLGTALLAALVLASGAWGQGPGSGYGAPACCADPTWGVPGAPQPGCAAPLPPVGPDVVGGNGSVRYAYTWIGYNWPYTPASNSTTVDQLPQCEPMYPVVCGEFKMCRNVWHYDNGGYWATPIQYYYWAVLGVDGVPLLPNTQTLPDTWPL